MKISWDKLPRYQKIVTSFLYIAIFIVISFTFFEFHYAGLPVDAEIYSRTMEVLLGLLGITGTMKVSENITEAAQNIMSLKYSAGSEMRGGE